MKQAKLVSHIRSLVDNTGHNPHWVSMQSGLTYRVVLRLYNSETIPLTTPIGTLLSIANALGVTVDDLYEISHPGYAVQYSTSH
jgi:hypothetical protein